MDKRRTWFAIVLEEALNLGVLAPEDVLRHATPSVLATDLPPTLVASLLSAGLDQNAFNPPLMIDHLGPKALAEHIPLPVLWSCLNEAAGVIIADHPLTHGAVNADDAGAVVDVDVAGPVVDPLGGPDIEVIEE